MEKPPHGKRQSRDVSALSVLWAGALMAALWILLVGGVHRDEMIVGACSVCIANLILRLIAGVRHQEVQITLRDALSGWRVPWYALQDLFLASQALLADLFLGVAPGSSYCVCGFKTSRSNPQDVARRVLVTVYSSSTPNVIIIGVDYAQSRLLFHQLVPGSLNQTMRDLGARG